MFKNCHFRGHFPQHLKSKIGQTGTSLTTYLHTYCGGAVAYGRPSDLRSRSRGFEARPRRCCATTLGRLFTPHCLCHQAVWIIWYQRKLGGKQAHHATHWPRVRGLADLSGVWLRATKTEISAALWASAREGTFTFLPSGFASSAKPDKSTAEDPQLCLIVCGLLQLSPGLITKETNCSMVYHINQQMLQRTCSSTQQYKPTVTTHCYLRIWTAIYLTVSLSVKSPLAHSSMCPSLLLVQDLDTSVYLY